MTQTNHYGLGYCLKESKAHKDQQVTTEEPAQQDQQDQQDLKDQQAHPVKPGNKEQPVSKAHKDLKVEVDPAGPAGPGYRMPATSNATVMVVDVFGKPYPNVEVWMFGRNAAVSMMQRPDNQGVARFYTLPVGKYRMEIVECSNNCTYLVKDIELTQSKELIEKLVAPWTEDKGFAITDKQTGKTAPPRI